MRSPRRCAPTPRPGKFLGQVVTMRQVMLPCAIAGAASAVLAAAPTDSALAVLKNSRLFMPKPPRAMHIVVQDRRTISGGVSHGRPTGDGRSSNLQSDKTSYAGFCPAFRRGRFAASRLM